MKRLSYFCPPETAEKLRCPERGFYSILRFTAGESAVMPEDFRPHPDDTLILVEINLCAYSGGELTQAALKGISGLFDKLRGSGCGLIVRFLYDWCGRNIITEPGSIDIILRHIEQLGPVIRENANNICVMQGLFIGNWGEMHGSRFIRADHLKRLYYALAQATEKRVRISVRTPALWRAATGSPIHTGPDTDGYLPGLFNDAMLSGESEYGTYSEDPADRERELRLQERLSMLTPYGGEVVGAEPQSDPERAMAALEKAKVSYLNRLYDEKTLGKWKSAVVKNGGIWNGMSYFDYAGAHLGYRFVIRGVRLRLTVSGVLTARIMIENTGFAPIYHDTAAELVFIGENRRKIFPMTGNADSLLRKSGARALTIKLTAFEERLGSGTYDVYFRIKSLKYNVTIPTANQGCGGYGCLIGRYTGL